MQIKALCSNMHLCQPATNGFGLLDIRLLWVGATQARK